MGIPTLLGRNLLIKLFALTFASVAVNAVTLDCIPNTENQTCVVASASVTNKDKTIHTSHTNGRPVKELYVFDKTFRFIPSNLGSHFPFLTTLIIQRSELERVERQNFKNLANLKDVSFWNNKLTELDSDTFNDLVLLESLNLRDNELTTLDKKTFRKLVDLKTLILDSNNIKTIDDQLFRSNTKMEILSLKDNYIKYLPNYLFENMRQLKVIRLDTNEIEGLQDPLFATNWQLKEFTVPNNKITSIGEGNHERFANLAKFDFLYNDCTEKLKAGHSLEDLKANCKALETTQIEWLKKEVEEVKRHKRSHEGHSQCLEYELIDNQANINFTRKELHELIVEKVGPPVDAKRIIEDALHTSFSSVKTLKTDLETSLGTKFAEVSDKVDSGTNAMEGFKTSAETKFEEIQKKVGDKFDETRRKIEFEFKKFEGLESQIKLITTELETKTKEIKDLLPKVCDSHKLVFDFLKEAITFTKLGKHSDLLTKLEEVAKKVKGDTLEVDFDDIFDAGGSSKFDDAKQQMKQDFDTCGVVITYKV